MMRFRDNYCSYFQRGKNIVRSVVKLSFPKSLLSLDGFIIVAMGPAFMLFYKPTKMPYISPIYMAITLVTVLPASFLATMLALSKIKRRNQEAR